LNLKDNILYGVKVIRSVPRYIDSAKYEADIILEILRADLKNESNTVNMLEYFYFEEKNENYFALVFEKLGKSLYDFIKENDYKGFSIENIQNITKQILEGMSFIHDRLKIVHTDLKVKFYYYLNSK
jgi:serine/threonine protein kinase